MRHPEALLGLFPLGCYLITLYLAYRMPHHPSSFWLWTLGWLTLGVYLLMTSIVRISVVVNTIDGPDTFRLWRFLMRFAGDIALMLFVLTQRMIFPSEHTLWGDITSDLARLRRAGRWCIVTIGQQMRRLGR